MISLSVRISWLKGKSKTAISRQAIVLDIGGFRPPDDPLTSWFGKVNVALPAESWPESNGQPMLALCQVNVKELPVMPPHLAGIEMLVVFIGPSELPVHAPNGTNWCLRTYDDVSKLQPLTQPDGGLKLKPFAMRARIVERDYPCLDDAESMGVSIDDPEEYQEKYPNIEGFKFGGWPTLIQGPVEWDGDDSEFVFQIDSNEKAHWQWGDGGVGYFGRRGDEWLLTWQCL